MTIGDASTRPPKQVRQYDVISPMLASQGDLWLFAILWRDVAKHEQYEGIERCEGCSRSHRSI